MPLPDFFETFPSLDLPFPDDVVTTKVVRSDTALAVFFQIHKDLNLPPHSHKGQWGTVIQGSLRLTMNDETRTYTPGDSYNIPSGTEHAAFLPAGTIVFDVFEEPDRYPLRS
ncbi:MAG: cupin domain-containing protein [Dinoroseobacter sp.]|nr:cupin domain-containing protein [Dinoroseobacter sp.]MDJ0993957.1 cupin domain-containing protein [Dinoroseobacter sp.]